MRYELSGCEWSVIRPMLPNKPTASIADDRRGHLATRCDKLAANYLAFIKLASIRLWLRVYESAP